MEQLDRRAFSDPSLVGRLEQMSQKVYAIDVARLKEAVGADARGQAKGWLRVTIPFTGSGKSLMYCPSSATILQASQVDIGPE